MYIYILVYISEGDIVWTSLKQPTEGSIMNATSVNRKGNKINFSGITMPTTSNTSMTCNECTTNDKFTNPKGNTTSFSRTTMPVPSPIHVIKSTYSYKSNIKMTRKMGLIPPSLLNVSFI